jgi:hypothetical protein
LSWLPPDGMGGQWTLALAEWIRDVTENTKADLP